MRLIAAIVEQLFNVGLVNVKKSERCAGGKESAAEWGNVSLNCLECQCFDAFAIFANHTPDLGLHLIER